MTTTPDRSPRLLPWTTPEGKPCYLSTDRGPDSHLSRLADETEETQLKVAVDVLAGARAVLDDPVSPHAELRYAGLRLAECLVDALRVAESRGTRIPLPDEDMETDQGGDPSLPAEAFG